MFVQSVIEVPFSLDTVRVEMLASVHCWLRPRLEEALVEGRVLQADVMPRHAADRGVLNVTVGPPCVGESMVSLPYRAWMDSKPWADFDSH